MMTAVETTRLSTKGQVVLPSAIRASRAWKPGTEFTVEETSEGILLKPAAAPAKLSLEEFGVAMQTFRDKAMLHRKRPATQAEMKAGIAAAVAKRHDGSRY